LYSTDAASILAFVGKINKIRTERIKINTFDTLRII